jgi:DNA polymerase III subunit epsilon
VSSGSGAIITVIDFETTGPVYHYPDEPWQIGLVQLIDGRLEPKAMFDSLLKVGIRPANKYVPGRYDELKKEVAAAPSLQQLWPQLKKMLQYPLAAHGIGTEKKILAKYYPLYEPPLWVDTVKIARVAFPEWKRHRLEALIENLNLLPRLNELLPGRTFHDALFDAAASALFLEYMLQQPKWQKLTPFQLSRMHPHHYFQLLKQDKPLAPAGDG